MTVRGDIAYAVCEAAYGRDCCACKRARDAGDDRKAGPCDGMSNAARSIVGRIGITMGDAEMLAQGAAHVRRKPKRSG